MPSAVATILRQATREKGAPLNILTFPTHERYETGLCLTGHNFYSYRAEGIKDWNPNYGTIPDNYHLLNPQEGSNQIPSYVDFDLILSQNKFGQFQHAWPIAQQYHLPIVSLEHTLPVPNWSASQREQLRNMRGFINVFISEYSLGQWGWEDRGGDTTIITHMVDTNLFTPGSSNIRMNHILSVVNDWINRDWCCNFQGWQRITQDLPVRVVGDTKGLSQPAPSIQALVSEYQGSAIFLNTSTISPVPTSLLEAMACGCACVSTATCMIPHEVIEHGINGFISNDEKELRDYCIQLLEDPALARELGNNARKTIENKFGPEKFIKKWNDVFNDVANNFVYRG